MLKGSFLVTTCVGILTGLIHWLKIIKYHINRQYNIIIKSYQPAAQTYPDPNPKLKKRQHCHTMGIDLCWRISLTHWGRIFISILITVREIAQNTNCQHQLCQFGPLQHWVWNLFKVTLSNISSTSSPGFVHLKISGYFFDQFIKHNW